MPDLPLGGLAHAFKDARSIHEKNHGARYKSITDSL